MNTSPLHRRAASVWGENVVVRVYPDITTSAITGPAAVLPNATGVTYSVINTPGSTYTWTITGGTQASGGTTNNITVDWGGVGSGDVSVTESNAIGCTGSTISLGVTIMVSPLVDASPPSESVCSGTATNISLSDPNNATGTIFNWTVVASGVSGASPGNGALISDILTATTSVAGTVTYTITPTNSGINGPATDVVVTVNPVPDVFATGQIICSGNALNIFYNESEWSDRHNVRMDLSFNGSDR